jgi:multiple antibiotic resistance protein
VLLIVIVPASLLSDLFTATLALFVILDPVGVLPFFVSLTQGGDDSQRKKVANRAVLIATTLLLVFAFLGDVILSLLGIQIADFEIAGGLLLLIFALREALSNEPLGAKSSATAQDTARLLESLAIIPIATPLLAGPGSLTTVILLTREDYGIIITTVAILVDCLIAWILLRASIRINKLLGPSTLMIVGKVMDILMAAIAVSFLIAGIRAIGLP